MRSKLIFNSESSEVKRTSPLKIKFIAEENERVYLMNFIYRSEAKDLSRKRSEQIID
jgi:hypothetical protein